MEYRNWLTLDMLQENSGSYYIDVKIDDTELINEIRSNIDIKDIYDTDEIIDAAFENISNETFLTLLKDNFDGCIDFHERILNEVISINTIQEFVEKNNLMKRDKVVFDLNETKQYLTETEQQMLLLLIMKAAKEQLNKKIGSVE